MYQVTNAGTPKQGHADTKGHSLVWRLLGWLVLAGVVFDASSLVGADLPGSHGLRLETYVTADSVQTLAQDPAARERGLEVLRRLRVTKVYLEAYRSGREVSTQDLRQVRDFFKAKGFAVSGGIATVPGGNFGVRANTGLTWFNWEAPKTRRDLQRVIRRAAGVFDEIIVDDFLCTGDTSAASEAARGTRSWSVYRRDLMTRSAKEVLIDPARQVHPGITMIIKFPQWYDRFQLFGYDVEREPALFDRVWVGTETRGARTQRYGFTQPYEGFVNYRWLKSIAGPKIGGAWFDHGDCDAHDFVEQAWQSVLAGAPEIVLFNYGNLVRGHPGHALLREDWPALTELARVVRRHPVIGCEAYKPPNSDAGGDLYLMDFIGMLGVPLVPEAHFPRETKVLFLPTQAAADPDIAQEAEAAVQAGKDLVLTSGLLSRAADAEKLCRMAGLAGPVRSAPLKAKAVVASGQVVPIQPALGLESELRPVGAKVRLAAVVDGRRIPFLTEHRFKGHRVAVLNVHTYSQADFDAVGEVLLPPRPLGLLEVPENWADSIRDVFGSAAGATLHAPTRVALQPLQGAGWFIQNYNIHAVQISLRLPAVAPSGWSDRLTGRSLPVEGARLRLNLGARSRLWVVPAAFKGE